MFMIGLHKEIEYKTAGSALWQYAMSGQIEYWVELEWYVHPCRFPMYLSIGLGGLHDGQVVNERTAGVYTSSSRGEMWRHHADMRSTMKPLLDSTQFEDEKTWPGVNRGYLY